MWHLFKGGVYLTVGRDRFVLTVILLFFNFNYNGAVAPRAMALNGAYYFFVANAALIQVIRSCFSTWF